MAGFVCDNVKKYEIVLSIGEIVQANAQTNSDLFIALKGGSNNLGIVTRFDFSTFQQGLMWGGGIYYAADTVPETIRAFGTFAADPHPDERAHLIAGASLTGGQRLGVTNVYYTTDTPNPPSLQPFVTFSPKSSNRSATTLYLVQRRSSPISAQTELVSIISLPVSNWIPIS